MQLGMSLGIPTMVGTMDGPFSPLDLSPVLWLDAADTSTITASDGAWLDGTGLQLPGLSGNYASTPDSAALSITGDIDIKVKVAMDDWTPATKQTLISKGISTPNWSYELLIDTLGRMQLITYTDGSSYVSGFSTATGLVDGATKWIRATLDVDNGSSERVYKFYLSDDGSSWTQLGTTVTTAGAISVFDSTQEARIGATGNSQFLSGTVYRVIIQDAFDTADNTTNVVFDADFAAEPAGTLSFTEDSTNAATVTLTTTYGQTSQWDDKSGNGYNVTQGTAANQPKSGTRTLNGRNVVNFDSSDSLFVNGPILDDPVNMFAVFVSPTDSVTDQYLWDGYISTQRYPFVYVTSTDELSISNAGASTFTASGYVQDAANLLALTVDENASPKTTIKVNGTTTTNANGNANIQLLTLGNNYVRTSGGLVGDIAEIIVIDGTLTADQIAATELHLGTKWGIYNVPDQITDLATSTIEATSIGLTWTAPAANGQTISQYVVEVSPDGSAWSTFGSTTSTSVTVTGLTTDVSYSFRVRAVNAVGSGGLSNVVTGTPFDVLALSPVLWLDASDTSTITEVAGSVSQWDDKSGNGWDFVEGSAASQPLTGTQTINGLNVLEYSSTSEIMRLRNTAINIYNQSLIWFWVLEIDPSDTYYVMNTVGGSTYGLASQSGSTDSIAANTTLHSLHIDGTLSAPANRGAVYTSIGTATPRIVRVAATSNTNAAGLYLCYTSGANFSHGTKLAEVIIANGTLSAGQIAATEQYLAQKWGITL